MTGKRILSIVGMAATFAVAYGLDRLVVYLREQMGMTASAAYARAVLWTEAVALLVLAALLLLLAWYVVGRVRDIWVGALFTAVGIVLTLDMALEMTRQRRLLLDWVMRLIGYKSYGHYVAAFVAVIGIACIVVWARRRGRPGASRS